MDKGIPPPRSPELDACIYDYLISRNMVSTAQAFVKETQGTPSAPDLQKLDVPEGLLSDWWSIFWDRFSPSTGDLERPDLNQGYALEEKSLEAGGHFSLEEQMQQRAATLANSNRSNNAVFSPIMQQDPVADSAVYQRFSGRAPIDSNAPGFVQQAYQQPIDDKGADDKLDFSREVSMEKTKGITIEEVFSLKASKKKIFCCSFSSDGELLASAGDENKVFIWNLRNNLEQYTWEAHSSFITDMSFGRNKTMIATASSDKTVRLWDLSQGGHHIQTFVGHSSLVRSVDFHPAAGASLLCSCDDGGKILFWKLNQVKHKPRTSEATGKGKVRFDPFGNCLASVIGNTVNLTNVETDKRIGCLQGNGDNKTVQSICWSEHFRCLACVSDDCVRIWPSQGVGPARELKGTKLSYYRSCSFHPKYPNTLVIGGYQTITLWDFVEDKKVSVQPHGCHVADLAGCRGTGLLASASHDGCVKVWR